MLADFVKIGAPFLIADNLETVLPRATISFGIVPLVACKVI